MTEPRPTAVADTGSQADRPAANVRPTVSVVVPHYSDLGGLDRCLTTLVGQTYPHDRYEIIVADNASPEGIEEVTRVIASRARLVVVAEKGAGPARNGGVEAATGDVLAFTDSDCQAEPEWISEGVAALGEFDFVGGRVKVLVDDPHHVTQAEAFERVFAFDFKTYITRKGFTGSGNLFCPRTLFDTVGGFRPAISEDVEWSHRARTAGFSLGYAPRAIVGHPARRTWDELRRKWRRMNSESFALCRQRRRGRLIWLVRSLALPASAVAHTPKVLRSPELQSIDQRWAALAMLYRIRTWRMFDALGLLVASWRRRAG